MAVTRAGSMEASPEYLMGISNVIMGSWNEESENDEDGEDTTEVSGVKVE